MLGITGYIRDLLNTRALDVAVVDANGDQITDFSSVVTFPAPPANATVTSVSASTTSSVLAAANANRRKFIIYNDSGKQIKIAYAATVSTTLFTVEIPNQAIFESEINDYTGVISVITNSGTGLVKITEITV